MQFILASASPRRLTLLTQVGLTPESVFAPEVNETPLKSELPHAHALRCALEKLRAAATHHPHKIILAADTVVACGRRILAKTEDELTARAHLALLSGRRHRVYTAIAVTDAMGERHRTICTHVSFARLSQAEIDAYIISNEWRGKAGAYAIQGRAAAFIPSINGAYDNVVGLPLYDTLHLVKSARPW